MLHCTETVTFVRLVKGADNDTYVATVFQGVSWFNKTRIKTENAGVVYDNAVQIRIPAAAITTQSLPQVGDYIVRGTVMGEIARRSWQGLDACADLRRTAKLYSLAHSSIVISLVNSDVRSSDGRFNTCTLVCLKVLM